MLQFVLYLLIGVQQFSIEVEPLAGATASGSLAAKSVGQWQSLTDADLQWSSAGQGSSLATKAIKKVTFIGHLPRPSLGKVLITLLDGTQFAAANVVSQGQQWLADGAADYQLLLDPKFVRSVLLQPLSEPQQSQWRAILESKSGSADTLVLIRSPEVLDKIEGTVGNITADQIEFEFSDQKIPAPKSKLAGLKLLVPIKPVGPSPTAIVRDVFQQSWQVAKLSSPAGSKKLQMELVCGQIVRLPLDLVGSIDFSIGSQLMLSDIKPLSWERGLASDLRLVVPGAEQLFGPQPSLSSDAQLRWVGSGTATYRVPSEYRRLLGSVQLAPRGEQFSPATVQIKSEGKVLWQVELDRPRQSHLFEVEVTPDSRLQLVLSSSSKFPVGDIVEWQNMRLLK